MEAKNLADLYNAPLMDWGKIEARLNDGITQAPDTGGPNRHTCWLVTINPHGSAHVNGIGAMWKARAAAHAGGMCAAVGETSAWVGRSIQ